MKNKKIGFWGGCFNPPSYAHINLAKDILQDLELDQIFFVPVGDYYAKAGLEKAIHRYNMLKIATKEINKLEVERIEIDSTKKLFAKDAFEILTDKYSNHNIYFIMGADNFIEMPKWKAYDKIIKKYNYIVVQRPNFNVNINDKNIIYYKPYNAKDMNSTYIRKLLEEGKDITNYINKDVYEYILKNNLYKN